MEFKLNYLPEKYEDILIPLMGLNEKLVLGGSLALHILDIMDYDFDNRKPDFDMSLLESLKFEDLSFIKDFFNLEYKFNKEEYRNKDEKLSTNYFLRKDLIQLVKYQETTHYGGLGHAYIIDFFNSITLPKKELILVKYKDMILKLVHPSLILSYKSKYAYDNRVGKQFKHFTDLKNLDWQKYFKIVKNLEPVWNENGSIIYYTHDIIKGNNPLPF